MKIKIKSYKEIKKTLDAYDHHKKTGLFFAEAMKDMCGKTYEAKKVVGVGAEGAVEYFANDYYWSEDWVEMADDSRIKSIIFKNRTTIINTFDDKSYRATCAEDDEWDYEKGAMAAAMKVPFAVKYEDILPYIRH